jgi:hypothetical protein
VVIRTDDGWLFQVGDAASPLHPASDIHDLESDQHTATVLPAWFVRRFLGNHAPDIRALLNRHGDEIQAISAHDIYSFQRHATRGGE